MGKLEVVVMIAALAGAVGLQSMDAPVEDRLIDTTAALMKMTQSEFEAWCDDHRAAPVVELDATQTGSVRCAWMDEQTGRAWHAALHFDGLRQTPAKADTGLVDASKSTLIRLVTNQFGSHDMNTGEGFLAWEIELDGSPGRLTVAPFEDITVVRMAREGEPAVLSMR